MKDRVPVHPGRVKLIPVTGQADTYDMVRADEPVEAGTPLNKASLLKDATALAYGLGGDAVPDEVLEKLAGSLWAKATEVLTSKQYENWHVSDGPAGIGYTTNTHPVAIHGDTIVLLMSSGFYTSTDGGASWVKTASWSSQSYWYSIAYGNGMFVAANYYYGVSYTSTDGLSWTRHSFSGSTSSDGTAVLGMAYGANKFVASGTSSTGWYSTDGSSWATFSLSSGEMPFYLNGRFVRAGLTGNSSAFSYSDDGVNWSSESNIPIGSSRVGRILYGNGKYYCANSSYICTSVDGITWESMSTSDARNSDNIAFSGGYFWYYGNSSLQCSPDGVTWTNYASDITDSSLMLPVCTDMSMVFLRSTATGPVYSKNMFETHYALLTAGGSDETDHVAAALGSAKVAAGSYVGTDTYGASNPSSLTFEFEPRMVIISDGTSAAVMIAQRGQTLVYAVGNTSYKNNCSWEGTSFKWYFSGSASGSASTSYQFNSSANTYYYIALA